MAENKNEIDFWKGADISFLPTYEEQGLLWYDQNGQQEEALTLLEKYGVNAIRLRLWHTPENVPEAKGACSLSKTIAFAKKIKEKNMALLLDFHYSDYWADPGQQRKPGAWEDLSFEELVEAVFTYTRDTLQEMKKEGVLPQMVQIGNEIRCGLLFPDGQVPDYASMVRLVNAGIEGARAAAGKDEMQIMLHLDQGGRYFYLKEWFDKAFENGLHDFDYIGLSFYPFWHGTFMDLKASMEQLFERYQKPLMVVETAHPFRFCENGFVDEQQILLSGYPATPEGQKTVLELVFQITASLPQNGGKGVFYWEPFCDPSESGYAANMGVFDENRRALQGIEAFLFERKDYQPEILEDLWRKRLIRASRQKAERENNLLKNADFKDGFLHFEHTKEQEFVCTEFGKEESAVSDSYLKIEGKKQFCYELSQKIAVQKGSYALQVEVMGTDTTNVDMRLFYRIGEKEESIPIHPAEQGWDLIGQDEIQLPQGEVTVGVRIEAPPMYAMLRNLFLGKMKQPEEDNFEKQ